MALCTPEGKELADTSTLAFSEETEPVAAISDGDRVRQSAQHIEQELHGLKDNSHHAALLNTQKQDQQISESTSYGLNPEVQMDTATRITNKPKHFNPFRESNPFRMESQGPNSCLSFIDSFAEDCTDGSFNPLIFENDQSRDHLLHGKEANGTATQSNEYVFSYRLSGQNLGMVLGIEGDQDNNETIDAVVVKSLTPVGAVAMEREGHSTIQVGDEIREINHQPLTKLTHDECVALLQELPDNVILTVCRKQRESGAFDQNVSSPANCQRPPAKRKGPPTPLPRKYCVHEDPGSIQQNLPSDEGLRSDKDGIANDFDQDRLAAHADVQSFKVPRGFKKLDLAFFRGGNDSLGLSIVPSYGATCDLYQIKRLLPSGICAESGQLEIGDRLFVCNGQSLKGLTQAQCLNVLKSSGNQVKLTVLRHTGDREQATVTENAAGDTCVSPHVQEVVSISESEGLNGTGFPKHLEQGDTVTELSHDNVLDIINRRTIQLQENVPCDDRNSNHLVDLEDIRLLGPDNCMIKKREDNPSEKSSQTKKDSVSSLLVPPPVGFSDADGLQRVELSENDVNIPLKVTNIDDLLFGTDENDQNSSFSSSEINASGSPHNIDNNRQSTVISESQKPDKVTSAITSGDTPTDFLDAAFTAQSLEEFAEECFGNIGAEIDERKNFSIAHISEPAGVNKNKSVVDQGEKKSVLSNPNNHFAATPILSSDSSQEYVAKIPYSAVIETGIDNHSDEAGLFQHRSDSHCVFTRNISINSQSQYSDVAHSKNCVQKDSFPSYKNDSDSSSIISHTYEDSYSSISKLPTYKVDVSSNQNSRMTEPQQEPKLHTTIGVMNTCQSGLEEDIVQPMIAVKDEQGTPLCIPSLEPTSTQTNEARVLDDEAKQGLAKVLSAINSSPSHFSESSSSKNVIREEVSEREIIPEILTHDQKEVVLNILSQWRDQEGTHQANVFQKAVSDVIDGQRHSDQHVGPENATTRAASCDSNVEKGGDLIQPMITTKIYQEEQLHFPSLEDSIQKGRILDDRLKSDEVIISSDTPQTGLSSFSQDLISEVDIGQSFDQKQPVMNVLRSVDRSEDTHAVEHALNDFTKAHQDEEITSTTSYAEEIFSPKVQQLNKVISDRSLDVGPHTVTKETFQISSAATECQSGDVSDVVSIKSKNDSHQVHNISEVVAEQEQNLDTAVHKPVNKPECSADISLSDEASDQVVLRRKTNQSADFKAKIDSFQQPQVSASSTIPNSRRPRSMIDTSSAKSSSRLDDLRKPFTLESKSRPAFRPLSALRPLSASTTSLHYLGSAPSNRPASGTFSSSTFTTRTSKIDLPKTRQENGGPFQVDVLKGIVGLGLKVKVTPEGHVQIVEIQRGGPIDKDGHVRVGDYILFINSTELAGLTDARVQQVLRLLPRGLTKLVVSSAKPSLAAESQELISGRVSSGVQLSAQPENQHPSRAASTDASQTAEQANQLSTSENTGLALSTTVTSESAVIAPEAQISGKIEEVTSTVVEKAVPATSVKKPVPVQRSKHDPIFPKAVPRHINESSITNITPRDLQESKSHKIMDTRADSVDEKYLEGEVKSGYKNQSAFDSKREMFEQKAIFNQTSEVPPKSKIRRMLPAENISSLSSEQILSSHRSPPQSPASPPLSPASPPQSQALSPQLSALPPQSPATSDHLEKTNVRSELSPTETFVHKEKLETVKGKIAPPVAPKPRVSSSYLTKSQTAETGGDQENTQENISTGYERRQTATKVARPLSIGEKSGTCVSSTAKMFESKETASSPVSMRHVSTVTHGEKKAVDTSVIPAQERGRSIALLTQTAPSQSASVTRPRSLNSAELSPKDFELPERSPSNTESPDDKAKVHISQNPLNAALSPRKSGSFDSSTSPPRGHASTYKEKSSSQHLDGKSNLIQKSNIDTTTSHTPPESMSPSQALSNVELSPGHHSVDVATYEHHSISSTSSILATSNPRSEEAVQNTMKNFDELLMDESYKSIDTDLPDMLLWTPADIPPVSHKEVIVGTQVSVPSTVKIPEAEEVKVEDEVKEKNVVEEIKDKERLSKISVEELKEFEEKFESLRNDSGSVSEATVADILPGHRDRKVSDDVIDPSSSKHLQMSHQIHTQDNPAEGSEKHEAEAEKESKHSVENIQVLDKLQEFDGGVLGGTSSGLEQTSEDRQGVKTECILEHTHLQSTPLDATEQEQVSQIEKNIDKNEISESINHDVFGSILIENEKFGEPKEDEPELKEWRTQASEIVGVVMSRIQNHPDVLSQAEKTERTNEPDLPESEPPPLPGAPPPPLILRDTNLLVSSSELLDLSGSGLVPENVPDLLEGEELQRSPALLQQCAEGSYLVKEEHTLVGGNTVTNQPDLSEENHLNKADSSELLISFEGSSFTSDNVKICSPHFVDLLSEDSGVTADEDKEVGTDEAISPFEKLVKMDSNLMQLSSDSKAQLWPSDVTTQNNVGLIVASEHCADSSNEQLLLSESNFDAVSLISDNEIDNLPLPLLPATAPPAFSTLAASTELTEEKPLQTSLPSVQASDSLIQSSDFSLFGGIVSVDENTELPVSKDASESRFETAEKSAGNKDTDDLLHPVESIQQVLSETKDTPSVTISSKRKWFLRSTGSKCPALHGEPNVPVHTDNIDRALVSALPLGNIISHLDKANAVLDSVSAPDTLVVIVILIEKSEDSIPLGMDLKQEGGFWFQVSSITETSPLLEDSGVHIGDWFLAVDDLWCNQESLTDLSSRLAEHKYNSLLVLARGEKPVDVSETKVARPVPSPRPRSIHKQQAFDATFTNDGGHFSMSSKITTDQEPILPSKEVRPVPNERHHKPSSLEQENTLQSNLLVDDAPSPMAELNILEPQSERTEIPPLPKKAPLPVEESTSLKTSEFSEIQADQAPPLPEKAPPTSFSTKDNSEPRSGHLSPSSEDAPPLSEKASPASFNTKDISEPKSGHLSPSSEDAPPLPEKAPPTSFEMLETSELQREQVPPFSEASPLLVEKAPSPMKTSEISEHISKPKLNQVPPLAETAPPPSDQTSPVHSEKMSSLPDKVLSKDETHFQQEEAQTSLQKFPTPPPKTPQKPYKSEAAGSVPALQGKKPAEATAVTVMHLANGEELGESPAQCEAAPTKISPVTRTESLSKATPRKASVKEDLPAVNTVKSSTGSPGELGPGIHKVTMIKGATGVGFCLEGGVDSPKGDVPITIKRIFKGGPAEKCGQLKVKDEILEVNGLKFTTMRHFEAWNHLKFLDDGEVHITIRRY